MSITDYLINAALILLVLRQVRESKLGWLSLALPLVLVAGFGLYYLRSVPTGGNDLMLEFGLAATGALLGVACGFVTYLRRDSHGAVLVRAGVLAAALWIVGIGSRIAFAQYAEHGGGASIYRFSVEHSITSTQAWVAGLILMAFAEVLTRLVTIRWRAYRLPKVTAPAAEHQADLVNA
jgi:thiamine transporter ThiT